MVAYELSLGGDGQAATDVKLEYLAEWTVDGPVNTIGLRAEEDRKSTCHSRADSRH